MRVTGLSLAMLPGAVLGVLLVAGASAPLPAIAAPEPGLEDILPRPAGVGVSRKPYSYIRCVAGSRRLLGVN